MGHRGVLDLAVFLASIWVYCLLGTAPMGVALAYVWGYRRGGGMFGLGILGAIFFGAGFKVWRDHCDPRIPAELRPSVWSAVVAWALGAFLILLAVAWYRMWWR